MIRTGDTLLNPVTLEEMTFLETHRETNGARTLVRITLPPHAPGVFLHKHTTLTEHFTVLEGQLSLIAGDPKQTVILRPGQSQFVERYALHRFWNATDLPVTFEVEIRPSRRFEDTIETLFHWANVGRVKSDGSPKYLFDLAFIAQLSESYLPNVPVGLQRAVFNGLALIARVCGYRPRRLEHERI
jgi:mannose-6-phosphate isomerase-like protein (cupin superfamily)